MKTFFKIFFACLFALGTAFFLFFAILIGVFSGSGTKVLKPEANSVLNLTLKGEITDRAYNNPFRNLSPLGALTGSITDESTIGLYELKEVLKYAKTDDHIKGIYLNMDEIETAPATMFDLRSSLEDFKKSGKFIYAYSNSSTEKNLLLNNIADKFYMNPLGDCEFDGFAIQRSYMKGLYDKLNVEFKVFYVGEYKSATESFRRTDMSPEDRLQNTVLLNDISGEYLSDLNKSTGISVDSLKIMQDDLSVMSAPEAVKYGLADGMKYEDDVKDEIKEKLGYKKKDDLKMITYSKYKDVVKSKKTSLNENKIALVFAEGEINDSKEDEGTVGGEAYVKMLRKLAKDDAVKGVVLRVNSPGGSAFASEQINHEIEKLKAKKPVVVSMGNYAASGGYYISANADKIIAEPSTISGSIGIFGIIPNFRKALNEKAGVTFDEVKTAKHANYLNLTNDWDEVELTKMQQHVEYGYSVFLDRVAKGRKMDTAAVNKIARGRVWTGVDAKNIGLVDELGGMELAIQRVKELAKIKSADVVTYPKEKTLMESLLSGFMGDDKDDQTKMLKNLTPQLLYLRQLERIKSLGILRYSMPYELTVK
ncbi:MAG: signal peptide peptidase SppA, type [Bacteroidota bacterium]|nr:signal peptide peptidase SppA, type [Bacteroidota bacterium]